MYNKGNMCAKGPGIYKNLSWPREVLGRRDCQSIGYFRSYHLTVAPPPTEFLTEYLDLGLNARMLKILACDNAVRVDSTLLETNVGLGVCIKLLSLDHVEIDWVAPGDKEEDERNAHGLAGANFIRDVLQAKSVEFYRVSRWFIR